MKTKLLLLLLLVFSNCEIKTKEISAQNQDQLGKWNQLSHKDYVLEGMTYRVFISERGDGGTGMWVVNLTKDKLEVELLKKQLSQIK